MSESPLLVSRSEFTAAGNKQHKTDSVITRAWNDTVHLAHFINRLSQPQTGTRIPYASAIQIADSVDFSNVMRGVRFLETGEWHLMLIGQTAWNLIADINNRDRSPADPDFLISWSPSIHPDFRNGVERRKRAAERLQAAYQELGRQALSNTVVLDPAVPVEG